MSEQLLQQCQIGVGGELHAPAALSPGKRPGSYCIGDRVGPKPSSSCSFFKVYSSNQNRSPPAQCHLSKPCQRPCQMPSLRRKHWQGYSNIPREGCRLRSKCDGTRAETRFRLSAKRTSPFKSAGASVQSTTCSRAVRISGSNAGYTMFRGSVKGTGYPLHSPVIPSFPHTCVTVCHHISTGLYSRCVE
jgi:hypothetical protein